MVITCTIIQPNSIIMLAVSILLRCVLLIVVVVVVQVILALRVLLAVLVLVALMVKRDLLEQLATMGRMDSLDGQDLQVLYIHVYYHT